jgi:2'-5' RNA ligase
MPDLIAIDVAILPPADVTQRAIALSASLPQEPDQALRLDSDHLPHITLMQLFVRANELETAFGRIRDIVQGRPPLLLRVPGSGKSDHTVWMEIERTGDLVELHERLMQDLRGIERENGSQAAFFEGDARINDVMWVAGYRLKSSLAQFTPHITLGHAAEPPPVEPFAFEATRIAVCHLGRFCACRRVLREWTLNRPHR